MTDDSAEVPSDEHLAALAVSDPASATARAAAAELLGRHQRRVYLWCHRYVRDHDRALELAQDVLMSTYRSLHTFGGRSKFTSWLFAITRNKCLNAVAASRMDPEDPFVLDRLEHPGASPADEYERNEEMERLRRMLTRHLDVTERQALWMLYVSRMPLDEITSTLGLGNASGARGLLQRAKRRLRAAYEREGMERTT